MLLIILVILFVKKVFGLVSTGSTNTMPYSFLFFTKTVTILISAPPTRYEL